MRRLVLVVVTVMLLFGCAMLEVPLSGNSHPTAVPAFELSWQTHTLVTGEAVSPVNVSETGIQIQPKSYSYLYRTLQANGTLTAHIPDVREGVRAGLMLREQLELGSKGVFVYTDVPTPKGKNLPPAKTATLDSALVSLPVDTQTGGFYLRLERADNRITVSFASEGETWTLLTQMTLELPSQVFIGLAVDPGSEQDMTVDFSDVSAGGTVEGETTKDWHSTVVGELLESQVTLQNAFGISVTGGQIGHRYDNFHFIYKYLNGDFDCSAQIASLTSDADAANAGLMVRGSLATDDAALFVGASANGSVQTKLRERQGETTQAVATTPLSPPLWLRLERKGQNLQSYLSSDSKTWQRTASVKLVLPTAVYVGLAVAANGQGSVRGEFTSVDCKGEEPTTPPSPPSPPPPTPPIPEPPPGSPPPPPTPVSPSDDVKIILHQQPSSRTTVDAVAATLTTVEELPVDGITVSSYEGWNLMSPGVIYSYADLLQTYGKLEGKFSKVTENYALVLIDYPGDLFDDAAWEGVIENWRNLAAALRDTGFKGIFFDNEEYQTPWFNYPEDIGNTHGDLATYQTQARLRGKQLMEAASTVFPDIKVLTFHGPYLSESKTPESVKLSWGYNASEFDLAGAFFVGMMEGRRYTSVVIDGGEFYLYRSYENFWDSYVWRKVGMGLDSTDSSFIPATLRNEAWAENISISFGLYNVSYPDPVANRINGEIMSSALGNALCAADELVWVYVEDSRNWYGGEMPSDFREGLTNTHCPLQGGEE